MAQCLTYIKSIQNSHRNGSTVYSSFTSAIRTGFVFTGKENITLGGGDDVWLFLNRKLVLEVITPSSSTNQYCKRVRLENAVPNGNIIFAYDMQQTIIYIIITNCTNGLLLKMPLWPLWQSWLRHHTNDQKIMGSNPG